MYCRDAAMGEGVTCCACQHAGGGSAVNPAPTEMSLAPARRSARAAKTMRRSSQAISRAMEPLTGAVSMT